MNNLDNSDQLIAKEMIANQTTKTKKKGAASKVIGAIIIVFIIVLCFFIYQKISQSIADNSKKQNLEKMLSYVRSYQNNKNGKLPPKYTKAWEREYLNSGYFKEKMINPITKKEYQYKITIKDNLSTEELDKIADKEDYVFIDPEHKCQENDIVKTNKDVALRVLLSSGEFYCLSLE